MSYHQWDSGGVMAPGELAPAGLGQDVQTGDVQAHGLQVPPGGGLWQGGGRWGGRRRPAVRSILGEREGTLEERNTKPTQRAPGVVFMDTLLQNSKGIRESWITGNQSFYTDRKRDCAPRPVASQAAYLWRVDALVGH